MSESHWQVVVLGTLLTSPLHPWWLSALALVIMVCAAAFIAYVGYLEAHL